MAIPEQIPLSGNPWIDWWVRMGWRVAPTDYSDPFPTHLDILGKWWYQSHKTIIDRDLIITDRRSRWMLVYVWDDVTPTNNWAYELKRGYFDTDINNNLNRKFSDNVSQFTSTKQTILSVTWNIVSGTSLDVTASWVGYTLSGDVWDLWVSIPLFNWWIKYRIYCSWLELTKWVYTNRVDQTHLSLTIDVNAGDVITILS